MPDSGTGPLTPQAVVRAWMEAQPQEFRLSEVGSDLSGWQQRLRERLWALLGGRVDPSRDLPKPDLQVGPSEPGDGYTARRLTYITGPGTQATALLLTPDGGRRVPGAVLALHGHGTGKDAAVAGFGADLARRGYLVVAPEAMGFGERADPTGAGCHTVGMAALLMGRPVAAQRLRDDVAALTLLRALAGSHKLAVAGHSEGGRRALLLGALDERAAVVAVSGYFTVIRHEVAVWDRLGGWDICNAVPGLLGVADLPELAALCPPRALCIDWGRGDGLYTQAAVEQGTGAVEALYAREGLSDRCFVHAHDGGHRFGGAPVLEWLQRQLAR